jgi:GTP-binding protein HflX
MGTNDQEKAIVVGVGLKSESLTELKESLAELVELAETAGANVIATFSQALPKYNPATVIGSGKVQEIKDTAKESKASLVVIDHQLSGVQIRNLEKAIGTRILDRTQIILDIFAQRAQSHEGKLQVELAQMLDLYSRMVGAWLGSLSRLGGGIGTRGPGEKALEIDRRAIRRRIDKIKSDLEQVRKHRAQHRSQRKQNRVPSLALIGYTNAGKSTLLNRLTQAGVMVQDQVFATLDPTTRKLFIPNAPPAVITDTVGFIRKLPTKLVEAFKATLEESAEADVLLNVIDLSSSQWKRQCEVVKELIDDFGWSDKPIIHVFNKMDRVPQEKRFQAALTPRVFVSAQNGEGIDQLKEKIAEALNNLYEVVQLYFPLEERHKIFDLGRQTHISKQEESSTGVICYAHMTPVLLTQWSQYLVK